MKAFVLCLLLFSASSFAVVDFNKLPAQAKQKVAETLKKIPKADHKHLRADRFGELLYVDNLLEDRTIPMGIEGDVDPDMVFKLHSLPGSVNTMYLDFDGEVLEGRAWNRLTCTNCVPKLVKPAKAYDPNNDGEAFAQNELNKIYQIWQRVVDSFAGFDIDVTTERPAVWTDTTGHVLFTDPIDADGDCIYACSAGGVAFVNVFGTTRYQEYSPALAYASWHPESPSWAAVVASHEFGHNVSLSHHGSYRDDGTVNSYYGGHGLGLISWGPTMGSASTRSLNTWSNGDYPNANNSGQDDVAIIGSKLGYIADDNPTELPLTEHGIINSRDDTDVYYFDVAGGSSFVIRATPNWITYDPAYYPAPNRRHTRLDIELVLVDPNGITYVFDEAEDTEVSIDIQQAYAGRYYLAVNGAGNINATDYDSIGEYYIAAEFSAPPPPPPPPPPPEPERTLSYSLVKVKGDTFTLSLEWQGLEGEMVDLRSRNRYNQPVVNDGQHNVKVRRRQKGTYYYLCETDTDKCTNRVYLQF